GDHNEPLVDAAAMQILMRSTLEISIVFEGLRHHLDEIMDRLHSLKGQDASDNDAQLIAGMLSTRVNWLGDCDDKGAYQKFRSACNKGQKLG
ncbi:MAG: hypothetical protein JWN04_3009, partial [Myxococcaceae bacterium]|nr:hypothetical protein [Myxococcaceae bacterium]